MSPRLDAHAHFFYPGFVELLAESCRRVTPDEITLYQSHAQRHAIEQVLAVGYEGAAWAMGNNAYLATLSAKHPWVRPVAFVADPCQLTVEQLVTWQTEKFVGISLYLFDEAAITLLSQVTAGVWQWLADHAWLLSVNSTGEWWTHWQPILTRYPELRLLIAHLGLPPSMAVAPPLDEARVALASVLQLAAYPHVHVKFSGFYALAQPSHAYPHAAAMPYGQAITEAFGTQRIIWASDFSPALEVVSFPQTVDVLLGMVWLTPDELQLIYYDNLNHLLATVDERNPKP